MFPAMRCLLATAWAFVLTAKAGAAMHLTEIMASNATGLTDEDGAHSDWIELHNSGPGPVNLRGWHLTDDPLRATRWEFPELVLPAGGFVVVFASGKDRSAPGEELHTDFSLAAEGEYLALTDPAGQEADEFAPGFPPQVTGVSWGLVPGAVMGTHAYFYQATAGTVNITSQRASEQPVFSEGSRTFTAPFTVTLSSPQPGAQIFYTLDGSEPATGSTLYTGPVVVMATTRLRAIARAKTLMPSLAAGAAYVRLAADAVPASSNLPLMILDNFGAGRPEYGSDAVWLVFEPGGAANRTTLTVKPAIAAAAYIKVRGSSTASANKYSLAVEARNEAGGDRDFPLLGLPADSDWVLTAPYEYDRALIRNSLMYQLSNGAGRYAPRTRQVELYLNTDGGAVTAADYFGVYTLTERIKRGGDRVDVAEISPLDNSGTAVTGGYLLKIDRGDVGETGFTAGGQTLYFVDPDEPDITPPQKTWLTYYLNNWRTALTAQDFFDPQTGYAKWGDPASFADHHILNVAAKNVDALRLSAYLYKDRLGRLAAGPLWDFDRSLESTDGRDNNFNTWRGETGDLGTDYFRYTWYNEMFRDRNFWQHWIDRCEELRRGPLGTARVQAVVDAQAAELTEAAARNFLRWSDKPPRFGGWAGEVANLRGWFTSRLAWMDNQFTRPPVANTSGGPAPPGFQLSLTSPSLTRPGAVIYYTTDGSDPRAFDVTMGQQIVTTTFIGLTHPVKVHLPVADIGTDWRDPDPFDDSAWWAGIQGVGYDDRTDYDPYIGFNLESPPAERRMKGVTQTCYIRMNFTATAAQIAPLTFLKLRARCDDGMAVWLNGTKLPASIKEPAGLTWNSGATSATADTTALQFTAFFLQNPQALLREGDNLLAIHGLDAAASSDFLIQVELLGGYVPVDAPEAAPRAMVWDGPRTITETTHLFARTYDPAGPFNPWPNTGAGSGLTPVGSHWSAPLRLSLLSGTVPASAANLTVLEIMYHPGALTDAERSAGFSDRDEFEYLVLQNTGNAPVDLTGIHFTSGIEFVMPLGPSCVLAPGERGILAKNRMALAMRMAPGLKVIGEYTDKLSNAGETLRLAAADGAIIFEVPWDNTPAWPQEADGAGYSLVRRGPGGDCADPADWRRSLDPNGEAHSPAPLAFAAWQVIYFPSGGDPAPEADPDSDGVSNAVEYLSATDPGSSRDAAAPVARTISGPGGTVITELTLRRRPGAAPWLLESSPDLVLWSEVGSSPVISPNTDGSESATWSLPQTATRVCYRARAVIPGAR